MMLLVSVSFWLFLARFQSKLDGGTLACSLFLIVFGPAPLIFDGSFRRP